MNTRSKASFIILAVMAIVSVLLSSCGATPTAAPTTAPVQTATQALVATQPPAPTAVQLAAAPVHLTMWFETTGSNVNQASCLVAKVVGAWNDQHPDILVDATLQANAWDATRTAVAGGGGPDIVFTPGPSFAFQMAQAGELLPLDDYATKLNWNTQFLPWALALGKVDGKLYSIPNEVETTILYYNKTVFDANGWTPPTTMAEYLTLIDQIKAAGLIPNGAANADWKPANEHYWTMFVNGIVGPQGVYDALTGTKKWTDPEFVNALDTMDKLFMNGAFMGGLDRYYTTSSDQFLTDFGDGKAAMVPTGSWLIGTIGNYFGDKAANKNDWDWVPFPTTDGTTVYPLGIGSTESINAATKYPEQSAEFLTYYFSAAANGIAISQCGFSPAPINIKASDMPGMDPRRARLIESLSIAAGQGNYGYTTWTFWPPKSDTYIYTDIEKVWAGQETAQTYLAGLQTLFDQEAAAGNIPPIPAR